MREVRVKRDDHKSRDRFWEMKGTKMGDITGTTKKEEAEAADFVEKHQDKREAEVWSGAKS